jgi:serine protease
MHMKKQALKKAGNLFLALAIAFVLFMPVQFSSAQAQEPGPLLDQALPTDQIIIQYKTAALGGLTPEQDSQMERLSAAAGVHLGYFRAMTDDTHVLKLDGRMTAEQVQAVADQLMTLPEVAYASPDRIFQHTLTPNDPQYSSQWHYYGTYGINAPAAWNLTTGSSNTVVAVVDTGITNHADLSGRTVAGYDFIADSLVANDGGGRDSNPSDPGDWITAAENASGYFQGCGTSNSSWHGTHVSGTIGAASNNSVGVAGINWVSKIQPIRVLGKCGGYMSDIIDGIKWAAGLSVSGIPNNTTPAKVINLSLGGYGSCSSTLQAAVNAVVANGSILVIMAGNSNADAVNYSPGNCANVITVAATNNAGSRSYYSNYGSSVEIAAPGGEQYYSNDPGGVLSTLNTGATTPASDAYVYYQGTSMAAPHVTGVVSLMTSINPYLSPDLVRQLLQNSAKAFPGGSSCNTSICGSGIVDAYAAVDAATPQIFYDVLKGHWAASYIERLYNAGITGGCSTSPLLYCPSNGVTRAEMAVFLLRGIHGSSYAPPPVGASTGFADVPTTHWAAAWIKQLATEGITSGCDASNFCPTRVVNRAEMSVFLLKAKHTSSYTPPLVGASTGFSDVPTTHWAAAWIKQLAAENISTGCGSGAFCPADNVVRDQMAVFLVKTFNLP